MNRTIFLSCKKDEKQLVSMLTFTNEPSNEVEELISLYESQASVGGKYNMAMQLLSHYQNIDISLLISFFLDLQNLKSEEMVRELSIYIHNQLAISVARQPQGDNMIYIADIDFAQIEEPEYFKTLSYIVSTIRIQDLGSIEEKVIQYLQEHKVRKTIMKLELISLVVSIYQKLDTFDSLKCALYLKFLSVSALNLKNYSCVYKFYLLALVYADGLTYVTNKTAFEGVFKQCVKDDFNYCYAYISKELVVNQNARPLDQFVRKFKNFDRLDVPEVRSFWRLLGSVRHDIHNTESRQQLINVVDILCQIYCDEKVYEVVVGELGEEGACRYSQAIM